MSEKRFVCVAEYFPTTSTQIKDTKNNETYDLEECCEKLNEQQATIDKQELRLQCLEEILELSENLNKSYREKLIDMNLKMMIDDEENEQLKEQLQMIKEIIQTQITETKEYLQISIRGGMPTGSLYSEIELLQKLKKECFDE